MAKPNVVDVAARTGAVRQNVKKRIEQRLKVLRKWSQEGVPDGKILPKSLTAVRLWDDPELGIVPICSPNDFTSTHCLHGSLVKDVAVLLTELKEQFDQQEDNVLSQSLKKEAKFDRKAFDRQLETLVSQWHTERDGRLQEKKRADAAEARSLMLIEECRQKDELIADLRRQLTSSKGPRIVT